jgi:spore maturation protein CgeB
VRWVVAQPGPSFSVEDVYAGWCEALEDLGQTLIRFNLDSRISFYSNCWIERHGKMEPAVSDKEAMLGLAVNGLYAALYKTRPDVLMVVSGFFIPVDVYELARMYGTKVVIVHTEAPYEDQRQAFIAQYADINLVNDPTNLSMYPPWTKYVPQCYRPSLHHPGPGKPEMVCDLAFVGTGYPNRIQFLEAMDLAGLDVLLAGNWQRVAEDSPLAPFLANDRDKCLANTDTADVYRSARVGMNLYRGEAQRPELVQGWSMGPREVEMAACGLFHLREPRGEGDEVLDMLPTFTSPEEASDLLRYWLGRPAEREEAALKARSAIADRTFHRQAVELLQVLDQ